MSAVLAIGGLIALGIGLYLLGTGWRRRSQRQAIASVETTDVLSVVAGPTEVYGTAERADEGVITAPFSESAALIAEWRIEEWDTSGKHSSWTTRGSGTLAVPFAINDGTDSIHVDPDGADIELSGEWETVEVDIDEEPPGPVKQFVELDSTPGEARGAIFPELTWGNEKGDRKYHQRLVRPGDELYVHGTATQSDAREFGAGSYELVEAADDGHRNSELFLIADTPESGVISSRRDAEYRLALGVVAVVFAVGLVAQSIL